MANRNVKTKSDPIGRHVRWDETSAMRWRQGGYWLDKTLADLTRELLEQGRDREIIIEGERHFTISQVFNQARKLANALLARGFGPGSVMSYQLPNWHEASIINLAAAMIGGAINPLVPIYRDNELAFMLDDVKAGIVFVPKHFRGCDYAAMMLRVRERLHHHFDIVVLRGEVENCVAYADLISEGGTNIPLPQVDPDSVYVMMHTSGTTGRAKCVLHSHNSFLVQGRVHAIELRASEHDIQIVATPISHVAGIILANVGTVVGGTKIVLMERWSPQEAIALIHQHNGTSIGGATPFLQQLLDAARATGDHLPMLTRTGVGGSDVPPDLIREAHEWFTNTVAFRIYGCTEVPTATSGTDDRSDIEHGAETDGRIKYVDVRIVDTVTGVEVPAGTEGEILLRGPQMLLGYLRLEDNEVAFDPDGFFMTGDLGRIVDGDYILITGRKKDLIIRSGENLSPKEIEDVLHTHPAIAMAAVVGMPNRRSGECVCAFIVLNPGQSVDLPEIEKVVTKAGLSRQKVPEHLEFVEELPTSVQGKVLKIGLRKLAAEKSKALGMS